MRGVVYDYLSADHDRLDALLESATAFHRRKNRVTSNACSPNPRNAFGSEGADWPADRPNDEELAF